MIDATFFLNFLPLNHPPIEWVKIKSRDEKFVGRWHGRAQNTNNTKC